MSTDVLALVAEYALGVLEPADAARVEAAVAQGDEDVIAELAETQAALAGLAEALPPAPPQPSGRARLLDSLAHHDRFAAHAAAVAALVGDRRRRAVAILRMIDDAQAWTGPGEMLGLMHLRPGPDAAPGADIGLVRIPPGGIFPDHDHVGPESVLVLQGRMRDSLGHELGPGDQLDMAAGTAHALESVGTAPLIYLSVTQGIEMGGFAVPDVPDEMLR